MQKNRLAYLGSQTRSTNTAQPLVDNLHILPLEEVAHLWLSRQYRCCEVTDDLLLLFLKAQLKVDMKGTDNRDGVVPLLKAQLSLAAEDKGKVDLANVSAEEARTSGRTA
jgi:hypothetical protein